MVSSWMDFPAPSQAEALDQLFEEIRIRSDGVMSLRVEHEEVVSRLTDRRVCRSCGRIFNSVQLRKDSPTKCPTVVASCSNGRMILATAEALGRLSAGNEAHQG